MTRPDPLIRPMIQVFPTADSPKDPNEWRLVAATIFFAIAVCIAVQL